MNIEIIPENTAINRGVSQSTKYIEKNIDITKHILDYGFGKGRNLKYLNELGYDIDGLDTQLQVNKQSDKLKEFSLYDLGHIPNKTYDVILSAFVMCVILEETKVQEKLRNIDILLNDKGLLVLETRTLEDILTAKTKESYGKGFILGSGEKKHIKEAIL